MVEPGDLLEAKPGALVVAEILPRGRMGLQHVRVTEVWGIPLLPAPSV